MTDILDMVFPSKVFMLVFLAPHGIKFNVVVLSVFTKEPSQIAQFLANFSVFRNYQSTTIS